MSNLVPLTNPSPTEYSDEQVKLIRDTIAKGATDDEFKLFMYRAKNMGLDPLKPGQIYFVKYGNSPGTIILGIDGMRSRAERTGKHEGTRRGILRDDKGKCIAGWAEVYRMGWREPAREEAPLAEYVSTKQNWQKMPETMIKKVAEAAALRIAFPDELGGTYIREEMDQAEGPPVRETRDLARELIPPRPPVVKTPLPPLQAVSMSPTAPDEDLPPGFQSAKSHAQGLRLLWTTIRKSNWTEEDTRAYLKEKFPHAGESTKKLPWDEFNVMLKHVESNPKPKTAEEIAADALDGIPLA
jgi:phage recombination protein Bet